jgi:N-hydroxyarylamine O-acetyltransferase
VSTPHQLQLPAYFARIGYSGAAEPSLSTLTALHTAHAQSIAFENLNPLLGWPVPLDPAALERKLVEQGRGGYCFEQNGLFGHVLRALGFSVTPLAARVLWGQADTAETARTHMLLRVAVEGRDYLADVGFGGVIMTEPLLFEPELLQRTAREPFRLRPLGTGLKLEVELAGQWRTMYRFDFEPALPPDYEVSNYWVSTHPDSHFVRNLMVARPVGAFRYALFNNELSEYGPAGLKRRSLGSGRELREVLIDVFGLRLPDAPELAHKLDEIAARAPTAHG